MRLPSEVRRFLKKQASEGGRKRWKGKTKAERAAHSATMHRARWGKNGA